MSTYDAKINLNTIVSRKEEIPTIDLDGEIGMMNVDQGKYYGLDSVGTHIWKLLENQQTVQALVGKLLKEYNIDEKTCIEHVLEFLKNLLKEGLLLVDNGRDYSV